MAMQLLRITQNLVSALQPLRFGAPVTHVYNPLVYAAKAHQLYLSRYGAQRPREVVLLGMNPGPWGMAQTGVPFGEVNAVRDWMHIQATVAHPNCEHPKRPIEGFACKRSEVSGARLWGWAQQRFGSAQHFFARFFVANYCPLVFMEESGRNCTPDKLAQRERQSLLYSCDQALLQMLAYWRPRFIIGIGAFAEARIRAVFAKQPALLPEAVIGRITHPSPASPVANRGWAQRAEAELQALGVDLP